MVEPQAGRPVLMKPRRGHSSEATDCGQSMADHRAQMQSPSGLPALVADRAL